MGSRTSRLGRFQQVQLCAIYHCYCLLLLQQRRSTRFRHLFTKFQAHNLKVVGSNPAPATTKQLKILENRERWPSRSVHHFAPNIRPNIKIRGARGYPVPGEAIGPERLAPAHHRVAAGQAADDQPSLVSTNAINACGPEPSITRAPTNAPHARSPNLNLGWLDGGSDRADAFVICTSHALFREVH